MKDKRRIVRAVIVVAVKRIEMISALASLKKNRRRQLISRESISMLCVTKQCAMLSVRTLLQSRQKRAEGNNNQRHNLLLCTYMRAKGFTKLAKIKDLFMFC